MVIQRELRVVSRRAMTYWGRFIVALLGLIFTFRSMAQFESGRRLFWLCLSTGGVFCILDALRRAAASLAEEKSEGTLGLLFLTPLSGSELLFGKFASIMVSSLPLALAFLPLFGISVMMGGVSGGEFLRVGLALIHTLSLIVVLGIFVSANAQDSSAATLVSVVLLALGIFLCAIFFNAAAGRWLNPLTPIMAVSDFCYRPRPGDFWWSLIISQAIALGFLWSYGRNFPREWRHSQNCATNALPSPAPSSAEEKVADYGYLGAPRWFEGNPVEWLTLRETGMHGGTGALTLAAAVCAIASMFTTIGLLYMALLAVGLAIFLCVASSRPLAVARHSGAFELILTTPLGAKGVLNGHRAALKRLFFWPCLIVVAGAAMAFFKAAQLDSFGRGTTWICLYALLGFTAFLIAAPWIGMWRGLRSKSVAGAISSTIFLTLMLPRLGACFWIDPVYFTLFGIWAWGRVHVLMEEMVNPQWSWRPADSKYFDLNSSQEAAR